MLHGTVSVSHSRDAMKKYAVLVADPPWPSAKMSLWNRQLPYDRMKIEEIKTFVLPPMAEVSVLFLWRLASMQPEALDVCRAWGYRPYGELVWEKRTKNDKPWMGMGTLIRGAHETCLIGVSSRIPKPKVRNIRSLFRAPQEGHSAKPDRFYEVIEEILDGPYVELFARRRRKGWTCKGIGL